MSVYRIHRMKESTRHQFRWAPHTIGPTTVKPRDYEPASTVEAATPYGVWMQMKETAEPLQVGDILEAESGELRIYKYVGFEEAQWFVAEIKPVAEDPSSGSPSESAVSNTSL